jgi:hypothetical protein
MPIKIWENLKILLNRVVDIITQGSLERIKLISAFNRIFEEAYVNQEFEHLCTVTTSRGVAINRHPMSDNFRSGFKVTIKSEQYLYKTDFSQIAKFFVNNKGFVKRLMVVGYDTLTILSTTSPGGLQIPLKDIASLNDYMLD